MRMRVCVVADVCVGAVACGGVFLPSSFTLMSQQACIEGSMCQRSVVLFKELWSQFEFLGT